MNTKPSRIRTTVCSLAVATVLGTATAPAAIAALNTAQIIASAVSQNCISWRVSGICYWLNFVVMNFWPASRARWCRVVH